MPSKLLQEVADYCWSKNFLGKVYGSITSDIHELQFGNTRSTIMLLKMCLETFLLNMEMFLKMLLH